jgi:tRNA(fMet)-specific endonuclease VapC
MIYDTNYIVKHIRQRIIMPPRVVIPIVIAGELQAFALKSEWGEGRKKWLSDILYEFPIADINMEIVEIYAQIDAYSQGKLEDKPLPRGLSARNMGKNDLWIAATTMYFDFELFTSDNDFDHLVSFGLRLKKV